MLWKRMRNYNSDLILSEIIAACVLIAVDFTTLAMFALFGSVTVALIIKACAAQSLDLESSIQVVTVHKCCHEGYTVRRIDLQNVLCGHVNETMVTPWEPVFKDAIDLGNGRRGIPHELIIGTPECGTNEPWTLYDHDTDRITLLANGYLRHTIYQNSTLDGEPQLAHHDYPSGSYCLDNTELAATRSLETAPTIKQVAIICAPKFAIEWTTDFVIRRIIDPVLHMFGIACLLTVAIVYFVLPPLRDLIGNMLSSISVCLIVALAADLVRIFTEFANHISFMVADIIMYLSILAAFFWLNSLGYYIWKTFRSRNVFLRVSDGRKYCYYSFYVWGCTITCAVFAVIAHFFFDANKTLPVTPHDNETIGWLGIAMFFTPVAIIILINLFFCLTTARVIRRMSSYGRIHGRMKYNFQIFVQLFIVMSLTWTFLLLSWLQFEVLIMINIWAQALQSFLILYICLSGSVRDLLKKGCCRGNQSDPQWEEEMISIPITS